MSSARATDSRHSKALLQSRSLRDFRTPPPLPRPDKPRRRVLQVNGHHLVREAYTSASGLSEPSHAELVQAPQKPPSHPPRSFLQVSPSIDGVASSPASSYEDSPNLRRPGVYESRNPPVNPRRHRRLCSDFGLNREEARVSPSAISSLASTPHTTYTETDSDSDVSVNQPFDYSFPVPPPINETLHLRRMHSSPMFDLGEAEQFRDISRKRWAARIQTSQPLPAPYGHCDGTCNISTDSRRISDLENADITRPTIHRVATNAPRNRPKEQQPSLMSQRLDLASPPPSLSGASEDISWKRATTMPHDRKLEATSLSNSLVRSASSSVGIRTSPPTKASVGPAVQGNFGRLPPELSESMDLLDLSIEKLKTHDPRQLPSLSSAFGKNDKKSEFRMSLSPPSLASAGRKKPAPRPYVFLPTSVAGPGDPSTSDSLKISRVAPDYRVIQDRPIIPLPTHRSDQSMPKSFIDITPEREAERSHRSRVHKLLTRASVSMFSWGKNMSRTKNVSK